MDIWTRARIAAPVGAGGAAVMLVIGLAEGGGRGTLWPDLPVVAAAFVGATAAGFALARLFGGRGRAGAARALLGALLATLLGAALAGGGLVALSAPLAAFVLAPVYVAAQIAVSPAVLAVWAVAMALSHLAARAARGP